MRIISRFGRFLEDFPLKGGTVRVPLPFSRNLPENHSHNLGKAFGEGFGLLCAPFTSLSLSLPLYISPSTFLSLSLLLFVFSLSFSLVYLMDVFVLVWLHKVSSIWTKSTFCDWSVFRKKFKCWIKYLNSRYEDHFLFKPKIQGKGKNPTPSPHAILSSTWFLLLNLISK